MSDAPTPHDDTAPMTQAQYHRLRLMQDDILHQIEHLMQLVAELQQSLEHERSTKH